MYHVSTAGFNGNSYWLYCNIRFEISLFPFLSIFSSLLFVLVGCRLRAAPRVRRRTAPAVSGSRAGAGRAQVGGRNRLPRQADDRFGAGRRGGWERAAAAQDARVAARGAAPHEERPHEMRGVEVPVEMPADDVQRQPPEELSVSPFGSSSALLVHGYACMGKS